MTKAHTGNKFFKSFANTDVTYIEQSIQHVNYNMKKHCIIIFFYMIYFFIFYRKGV